MSEYALGVYEVDSEDAVVELRNVPWCDPGAPMPALAAADGYLKLGYISLGRDGADDSIVVVTFDRPYAHFFGPPNDEAFSGHPLADRGLMPYGAYRVEHSSWVRRLERMNRVHPHHRPERFDELTHFILAFHDSTFECVAGGFALDTHPATGPLSISAQVTP
jgi:hypothetical protein